MQVVESSMMNLFWRMTYLGPVDADCITWSNWVDVISCIDRGIYRMKLLMHEQASKAHAELPKLVHVAPCSFHIS